MDFPFADAPNTACIVCKHVMDQERAIKYISHDAKDGMWQFLCDGEHTEEDARVVSLYSVYRSDPSIGQVTDMPAAVIYSEKW